MPLVFILIGRVIEIRIAQTQSWNWITANLTLEQLIATASPFIWQESQS